MAFIILCTKGLIQFTVMALVIEFLWKWFIRRTLAGSIIRVMFKGSRGIVRLGFKSFRNCFNSETKGREDKVENKEDKKVVKLKIKDAK